VVLIVAGLDCVLAMIGRVMVGKRPLPVLVSTAMVRACLTPSARAQSTPHIINHDHNPRPTNSIIDAPAIVLVTGATTVPGFMGVTAGCTFFLE
jgi:hypothetical protein